MATMRTDSPLARRIVLSFLHFLNSVEVVSGVDSEAIVVASQCLAEAFGLDMSQIDEAIRPELLPQLFIASGLNPASPDSMRAGIPNSQTGSEVIPGPLPRSTNFGPSHNAAVCSTAGESVIGGAHIDYRDASTSRRLDKLLFEQYQEGLESAGYFDELCEDTPDYQERLSKAKSDFDDTMQRMSNSSSASEHRVLAEAFKVQGNNSMAALRYMEAIDLYTMAISLCGDNSVYYSNRAAAHTQVGKYEEATGDCNKAIELDPSYSKAYSRLGLVYYAQGKYQEAIEKGFQKAHSLDPSSKSIQENLQAAQQKLNEERMRNRHQTTEQGEQQQTHTNGQNSDSRFNTSIPFNVPLPPGMANLFPAVANLAAQFAGQQPPPRDEGVPDPNSDGQPPDIRLNGSINVSMEGDQLNPQFTGLMQSMLQMFAGASGQPGDQQPPQQERNQSQGGQDHDG